MTLLKLEFENTKSKLYFENLIFQKSKGQKGRLEKAAEMKKKGRKGRKKEAKKGGKIL